MKGNWLISGALVLAILIVLELITGDVDIQLLEAFQDLQSIDHLILFKDRLPRTVLAILVGLGSAIAGLGIQTIFKNPLAGPTTLGINSGASLGVGLYYLIPGVIGVLGWGGVSVFAAIGSVSFLMLLFIISGRTFNLTLVLIVGLILSYGAFAFLEIMLQLSSSEGIKNYSFWGMGSLNKGTWAQIATLALIITPIYLFFLRKSNWLNTYLIGEDEVFLLTKKNVKKEKRTILLILGLLVGLITAIVGPIAFVGIIIPNLIKIFKKTADHKVLIPLCAILGANILLFSDLIAKGALTGVPLPLNAVLSILGVPFLIYLLIKRVRASEG